MADAVRKVLIADSDEGIRAQVRLTLSSDSYEVLEAADTQEALLTVARTRPDLLLVDRDLPGAGGLKISQSIKAQPETGHVQVVLLFPKVEAIDQDEGGSAGVDEYLAKPFTTLSLMKKVGELLGPA